MSCRHENMTIGEYEPLAQLVEHLTFNQRVEGSNPSWLTILFGPVGQAVKTPPFHGGNTGSNPVRVMFFMFIFGPVVSVVRMPACHAGDRRFESRPDRHFIP